MEMHSYTLIVPFKGTEISFLGHITRWQRKLKSCSKENGNFTKMKIMINIWITVVSLILSDTYFSSENYHLERGSNPGPANANHF